MPGISVEISASVAAAERGSLRAAASRSSHAIPCRRALGGSAMSHAHGAPRDFIPAAGRHFLLPLYDPFTRWLGVGALHAELLEQAALAPGQAVLDVGCGTGTLAVRLRREHPDVEVTALDPDAHALAIARRKAERAGVAVRFEQGFGDALPFADGRFDRVTSSMMFHHLDAETKRGVLRETLRVLRPGGSFHLVDFGHDPHHHHGGALARLFHRSELLRDNDDTSIAQQIADAGYADVERVGERRMLLGRIAFHRGTKPIDSREAQ
jgi:SAM-dependent methyltransferase